MGVNPKVLVYRLGGCAFGLGMRAGNSVLAASGLLRDINCSTRAEIQLLRYFSCLHPRQVLSKNTPREHLYEYESERDLPTFTRSADQHSTPQMIGREVLRETPAAG